MTLCDMPFGASACSPQCVLARKGSDGYLHVCAPSHAHMRACMQMPGMDAAGLSAALGPGPPDLMGLPMMGQGGGPQGMGLGMGFGAGACSMS